ncbi:hypothetical protein ACFXGT_08185 [Streptomyces sp. NPDC059352]|uniref:hypothetical protein n=1 Tax=Streptomyces sp. NPDC059352 TaxID=3346810 RepID=UPI00368B4380
MDEEQAQPHVVVNPPDDEGGRTVRIDGEISGRAFSLTDLVEFLRREGWLDAESWPPIEWRGGGPEVWSPEPPTPV